MKNSKYLIILSLLLLLCGCTGSYNLTIDDNEISEQIVFDVDSFNSDVISRDFYPFHNNFDIIYNKNINDLGNEKEITLNYSYSSVEYFNSSALLDCFSDRIVENNEDYYLFKLEGLSECFYGEGFDINIKTNNKVLLNNADSVKNNVYTWHVNNDNRDTFSLNIKIDKNSKDFSYMSYYFVAGLLIIVVVLVVYFVKKYYNLKSTKDTF